MRLNSKGPHPSSERKVKFRRYLFTFSIKRKIRYFHVVVVQQRQRNVQKSVMHVPSCCFAYDIIKPIVFLTSSLPLRRWSLKSLPPRWKRVRQNKKWRFSSIFLTLYRLQRLENHICSILIKMIIVQSNMSFSSPLEVRFHLHPIHIAFLGYTRVV